MGWIADYDTHGKEFPIGVHVTKTTGTMTHGATYVPIEDGMVVRAENAKLRELCKELYPFVGSTCPDECKHREECEGEGNRGAHGFPLVCVAYNRYFEEMSELGIEVDG